MISASDFVHLDYSPDLTPAGISFCRRLLPRLEGARGAYFFSRLRRIVASVAVELAFRRYLGYLEVPVGAASGSSFINREQYGFTLGGHRCNIISFLISQWTKLLPFRQILPWRSGHPPLFLRTSTRPTTYGGATCTYLHFSPA